MEKKHIILFLLLFSFYKIKSSNLLQKHPTAIKCSLLLSHLTMQQTLQEFSPFWLEHSISSWIERYWSHFIEKKLTIETIAHNLQKTNPYISSIHPEKFKLGISTSDSQTIKANNLLLDHKAKPIECLNSLHPKTLQKWIAQAAERQAQHFSWDKNKKEKWINEKWKLWNLTSDESYGRKEIDILVQQLAYLKISVYRCSIEWALIEPEQPTENFNTFDHNYNKAAILFYKYLFKRLREHNIEIMICFHHYSDPIWFIEKGGFQHKENSRYFTDFCKDMYLQFHSYAHEYMIMNQPTAYALRAYQEGTLPPFFTNSITAEQTRNNIYLTYLQATRLIKKAAHEKLNLVNLPKIGLSHQIIPMKARYHNSIDTVLALKADYEYNRKFLSYFEEHANQFDFIALSYYSPLRISFLNPKISLYHPLNFLKTEFKDWFGIFSNAFHPHERRTDMNLEEMDRIIDPESLITSLQRITTTFPHKPIYIIESGINTLDETVRISFLEKYLSAIATARNKYNIPVLRFYYWTLQNDDHYYYEWNKEKTNFGLYETLNQQPIKSLKQGGHWYKQLTQEIS